MIRDNDFVIHSISNDNKYFQPPDSFYRHPYFNNNNNDNNKNKNNIF